MKFSSIILALFFLLMFAFPAISGIKIDTTKEYVTIIDDGSGPDGSGSVVTTGDAKYGEAMPVSKADQVNALPPGTVFFELTVYTHTRSE